MRFIVFGGGGDMGRRVVVELAVTPGVERVTIAGRSRPGLELARERALAAQEQARARLEHGPVTKESGGHRSVAGGDGAGSRHDAGSEPTEASLFERSGAFPEVAVVEQDIADGAGLRTRMAEHDVAIGAAGPFYLLEEPLVRAAVEARTHYVSLCDDADATAAAFTYDDEARRAGVTVLTGLGWTPGLTNLLALRNAALLDEVRAVRIAWAGSASESEQGGAVILHTMHIFHGRVQTFADGETTEVRAGSGAEIVRFPPPVGPVKVCHVGHPEPLTLPERLPGVLTVSVKGGIVEPALHGLAGLTGRLRLAGTHGRRKVLARLMKPTIPLLSRLGPRPLQSAVIVEVDGKTRGADSPLTLRSAAVGPMAALTSVPAAVGALWIAQGRIERRGVFPPEAEGGPDPEAFLRDLADRGVAAEHTMV